MFKNPAAECELAREEATEEENEDTGDEEENTHQTHPPSLPPSLALSLSHSLSDSLLFPRAAPSFHGLSQLSHQHTQAGVGVEEEEAASLGGRGGEKAGELQLLRPPSAPPVVLAYTTSRVSLASVCPAPWPLMLQQSLQQTY